MSNRNISRRLKKIESELAPPSDKPGVIIIVSGPGKPDEIRRCRGQSESSKTLAVEATDNTC